MRTNLRLRLLTIALLLPTACVDGVDDPSLDPHAASGVYCPAMDPAATLHGFDPVAGAEAWEESTRGAEAPEFVDAQRRALAEGPASGGMAAMVPELAPSALDARRVAAPAGGEISGGGADDEPAAVEQPDVPAVGDAPGDEPGTTETKPTEGGGNGTEPDPSTGEDPAQPGGDGSETPEPPVEQPPVETGPTPDPIFSTPFDSSVDPLQEVPLAKVNVAYDKPPTSDAEIPAFPAFFSSPLQAGQPMPQIQAWSLEGKHVDLAQFKGKASVALIVGSASCMVFRRHSLALLPIARQVAKSASVLTGKKLEFVLLFTKEPHPAGEPSPYTGKQWTGEENVEDKVLVSVSKTFAHRVTLVRGMDARFKFAEKHNVWIDEMSDDAWQKLGGLPNTLFLIDEQGTLFWKEMWAMQDGIAWEKVSSDPNSVKPYAYQKIGQLLGQ